MRRDAADSPGVHVPPPLFYVAAMAAGALLRRQMPLAIGGGAVRLIVAYVCIALFFVLLLWSYAWFHRQQTSLIPNRPASALLLDGPFRFTRNPLYVAITLLTIGVGLWLNTWWVLILLVPAVVAVDRFIVAREEAYLRRRFGAAYEAYTARVRRWI